MRRLRKSDNKVFSGVCAGVSEYIDPDMDPVIIRIATVVIGLFTGLLPVGLIYLGLAIVLKEKYEY